MKRIVIAGVQSGTGKTTVALGLMAALVKRGMRVQGFKVGPDYLDPTYYRQITGRKAFNLDGWMTDRRYVRRVFAEAAADADISVVEGVMGLYDGYGPDSEDGSTAQMAKWLKAPVILVVDARGMSRSAAAVVKGVKEFDKKVWLAGVIFNNLGSPRHLDLLKEAISRNLSLPVFGGLLRDEALRLPERYLGLHSALEGALRPDILKRLIAAVEGHLDLGALLSVAGKAPPLSAPAVPVCPARPGKTRCRIAVARDAAFQFYYEDNFLLLEKAGVEIIFFSPLRDKKPPERADALYLGGGYPERYARELARNRSMMKAVRDFAESGRLVYAECGGLLYLCRSIQSHEGQTFPLAGVFPFEARMHGKRQALGYVEAVLTADGILGKKGTRFRGHEFHYSSLGRIPSSARRQYAVAGRKGEKERTEGYVYKNVLASYIHVHFGSQPKLARNFVDFCFTAEARRTQSK